MNKIVPPQAIDLTTELGESFVLPPAGVAFEFWEQLELPNKERLHYRHSIERADHVLLDLITSAHLACGFHSGDPLVLAEIIPELTKHNIQIGAHPSYPDMFRFGQPRMRFAPSDLKAVLLYQLGALAGVLSGYGQKIQHVKFHGGLYFDVAEDPIVGQTVVETILKFDPNIILIVFSGSPLIQYAKSRGLLVAAEAYLDRGYDRHGQLVARSKPGALLTDPSQIVQHTIDMVINKKIITNEGISIGIDAQTFCLHSDTPNAAESAAVTVEALVKAGVQLRPLRDIIL